MVIQCVHCLQDIYRIKKKILELQDHAKFLDQDNIEQSSLLAAVKKECESEISKLQDEQNRLHKSNIKEAEKLQVLAEKVLQKQDEERKVNNALQRATIYNKKYTLLVELYSQELNLLQNRKKVGRAAKCQLLQPYFEKYETDLTLRSARVGRRSVSQKDEIIVLQNELNLKKLAVRALMDRQNELRVELKSYNTFCAATNKRMMRLTQKLGEHSKDISEDLAHLQLEYEDGVRAVAKATKQLDDVLSSNNSLKEQLRRLKETITSFQQDLACYKRLRALNIM